MNDFRSLIRNWKTRAAFARAVGVRELNARMWYQRNSIPPEHWPDVRKAAQALGLRLSAEDLEGMLIAKRRRSQRERA